MGLLKLGTKALSNLSGSRGKMAALSLGVFGLGMANEAAPSARDAFLDVTTGTPNADKYFIGDKLSSRYLLGAAVGGPLGTGLKVTDPENFLRINAAGMGPAGSPVGSTTTGAVGGGILGGALGAVKGFSKGVGGAVKGGILGALGGGILGGAFAGTATAAANPAGSAMMGGAGGSLVGGLVGGLVGSRKGFGGFVQGGIKGAFAGGALGTAVGAAVPLAATAGFIKNNNTFFSQSPYARTASVGYQANISTDLPSSAVRNIVPNPSFRSSSLQTAMDLNASGDIVLGMHNSRRGY